jgi:MHS family proline/betaine transporter-like MFS transporter
MHITTAQKAKFFAIFITIIEWYDYTLYAYLAPIISKLYFPDHDNFTSLISTYMVFAVGFMARPIGAWIFGYMADYYSRKKAIYFSLILMLIATSLMLLLPTYEHWHLVSTFALVVIRLLQGVAVGGNYGISFVFAIENAPFNKRSFTGALTQVGVFVGFLLGSIICTYISHTMNQEYLWQIGWRLPFVLSVMFLLLALYLGKNIQDNFPSSTRKKESVFAGIKLLFTKHLKLMLCAIGVICLDGVGIYLLFFFYKIYLEQVIGISMALSYKVHTFGMALMILFTMAFGMLADKIKRHSILLCVCISFMILPYWGFNYVKSGAVADIVLVQGIFALMMGACYGALPVFIVELFPKNIRYSASGMAFNICICAFGGTSLMVALFLMKITANVLSVAMYLALIGLVAMLGVLKSPRG